MEQYFKVGVITATHGLNGEVKVFPTTDDPKRFRQLRQVLISGKAQKEVLEIERVKFFKNMVILKFKGYDSINAVETWRKRELFVPREQAVPLEEDEYYIADLLDMEVFLESGEPLGILTDVLQTGANDVYVVKLPDMREVLIPAIAQCILQVSPEENKMMVHLLEGMLE